MANSKITELTELSATPDGSDIIAIVDDPGGSPVTKKITVTNFLSGVGGGTRVDYIPFVLEVPEGTVAYPDVDAMTTTINKKVSGFIFPDGASASTVNMKCVCPEDLNASPAASVVMVFKTMSAVSNADIVIEYQDRHIADTEDADFTSWTNDSGEAEYRMPNADDSLDYATYALSTQPAAGDFIMAQIVRNPAASGPPTDDYTGDVQLVAAYLKVTVNT